LETTAGAGLTGVWLAVMKWKALAIDTLGLSLILWILGAPIWAVLPLAIILVDPDHLRPRLLKSVGDFFEIRLNPAMIQAYTEAA
jgi:hypothetical protein